MKNFESVNSIEIYEINGEDMRGLKSNTPKLKVREHWNENDFVVIEIDNMKFTVLAKQLEKAIENAQNVHQQ